MMRTELGIAMAKSFVNGARNLTTFYMGRWDIISRRDQSTRQSLDAISVNHYQIRPILCNKVGKTD